MQNPSAQKLLADLAANLPPDEQGWLSGLEFEPEAPRLGVSFAHAHFADWFLNFKRKVFEAALARAYPGLVPDYCSSYQSGIWSENKEDSFANNALNSTLQSEDNAHQPAPEKAFENEASDSFLTHLLDDFYCNNKNDLPLAAAQELVCGRGAPLTIFLGASGVGKSHLLRCLAQAWFKICSRSKAYRVAEANVTSAPEINASNLALAGICFSSATDFLPGQHFWRDYWALLLDDLDRLSDSAQEELLGLLNGLSASDTRGTYRRRIVLALGQDGLKRLNHLLVTRLTGGLVLEILPPDLDVRLRWLETQSAGLGLGRDQIMILARQGSHFHALAGLLQKLRAWSKLYPQPLGNAELEQLMRLGSLERPLSCREILGSVARGFALAPEEILGQSRSPDLVLARQMAMYLCRRHLGLSYPELGRAFGGRDHSTVIHAVKKIGKLRLTDKVVHRMLTELEATHN